MTLTHRGIWKPYRVEVVFLHLNAGNIYLDFDDAGINAIDGGAECFVKHGRLGYTNAGGTRVNPY